MFVCTRDCRTAELPYGRGAQRCPGLSPSPPPCSGAPAAFQTPPPLGPHGQLVTVVRSLPCASRGPSCLTPAPAPPSRTPASEWAEHLCQRSRLSLLPRPGGGRGPCSVPVTPRARVRVSGGALSCLRSRLPPSPGGRRLGLGPGLTHLRLPAPHAVPAHGGHRAHVCGIESVGPGARTTPGRTSALPPPSPPRGPHVASCSSEGPCVCRALWSPHEKRGQTKRAHGSGKVVWGPQCGRGRACPSRGGGAAPRPRAPEPSGWPTAGVGGAGGAPATGHCWPVGVGGATKPSAFKSSFLERLGKAGASKNVYGGPFLRCKPAKFLPHTRVRGCWQWRLPCTCS